MAGEVAEQSPETVLVNRPRGEHTGQRFRARLTGHVECKRLADRDERLHYRSCAGQGFAVDFLPRGSTLLENVDYRLIGPPIHRRGARLASVGIVLPVQDRR